MEQLAEVGEEEDVTWAARNEYWIAHSAELQRSDRRRGRLRAPLILTGHGVRLRVDRGALLIRDGFTHYPQERTEFRFFPGHWRTPSRIVLVDGSGGLSFDVLDWLREQDIELIRINWRGDVISVSSGTGYACNPELVQLQLASRENGRALKLAQFLTAEKIANSAKTLADIWPASTQIDAVVRRFNGLARRLRETQLSSVDEVLGIEGGAAFKYFSAWQSLPVNWTGTDKHPIPEDWRRVGWRSSAINAKESTKQRATHPVNAMLNYAYGMLENQVRVQVLAAGLDPTIGTLHGNGSGKHALVYDVMEPFRPVVDAQLLKFVQSHSFSPGDFTITSNGVCRLNPQLARSIIGLSLDRHDWQGSIADAVRILSRSGNG